MKGVRNPQNMVWERLKRDCLGGLDVWESNIKMNFEKVMCDKLPGSVEREILLAYASE
jgi:hypothetical protein